jgi:formylmethanofuran dehydrogenase subunit E
MNKITKQYVRYFIPSILVDETTTMEFNGNIKEAIENAPRGAHKFQFHKRTDVEDGENLFRGKEEITSPQYYIDAKVYTLEEVKMQFPEKDILISNMECNKFDRIVMTNRGSAQPFGQNCELVYTKEKTNDN